jgi:2-dehydropantoate 2-reductase
MHQAGHPVAVIARGKHLERIRSAGLRIEDATGASAVTLEAAGHPREISWDDDDVLVLAVKSHQTEAALSDLAPHAPAGLPIVCAQNGVANERTALRYFDRVYGMVVMMPALHLEPGVVVAHASPITGLLDVGCYPDGADDTAAELAATLGRSGFSSLALPDIMAWKYRKLLMNLGNAVQALCGRVSSDYEVVRRARAEGEQVLAAAGIAVIGTDQEAERRGDLLQIHEVGDTRRPGGSSWQSLARGTGTIEADYLNGEIALLGRLHDVPAPVNTLLQRLAVEHAARRAAPGSMTEEELLALLPAE